jgi:Uncharacterised nucleotidyltransferase
MAVTESLRPVPVPSTLLGAAELWAGVDRLVDRARSTDDLRAHGLHMLALGRYRSTSRPLPAGLASTAREATIATMAALPLLARVRDVLDGQLVVLKGPEAAARYRESWHRPFADLDLLVRDAVGAQRALAAAGFTSVGDEALYRDIHHLRPLHYASYPLVLEIHARPKWVPFASAPRVDELFEAAVPSALGLDGLLAPTPAHHALLLAAHSWAHAPLGRLLNLIDVAALRLESAPEDLDAIAGRWGVERLWLSTTAAVDALLLDGRKPWPLRSWARDLAAARHRTVLETHLERWLAGFAVMPFDAACTAAARAIVVDLRPGPDETWQIKLARTRRSLANAFVGRSEHDEQLASTGRERRR